MVYPQANIPFHGHWKNLRCLPAYIASKSMHYGIPMPPLLISMGENPLLIKERLGHEKIQTTLGTYGHLYPNTNLEVANKLTVVLQYTPATQSIADYTSNQHTAAYHKEVK